MTVTDDPRLGAVAPAPGFMDGRILVVDPEPATLAAVDAALRGEGLTVEATGDGRAALALGPSGGFDLVVFDLLAPGFGGLEGCRRLRCDSDVPLFIVSARASEADRVLGLEAGADDYLAKPFSMAELVSRVRAILRRRRLDLRPRRELLVVGDLEIDLAAHRVRLDGRSVDLTPTEFRLLLFLATDPGRAFSACEILRHLWHSEFVGDHGACKAHISNLRHKVEDDPARPRRVVTVRGVGYALATG
jgi:DNA-binding response OmpR family regulator